MEQSKLGAWILADEMGLGKTVSALSRLLYAYLEAKAIEPQQVERENTPTPLPSGDDNGSTTPPTSSSPNQNNNNNNTTTDNGTSTEPVVVDDPFPVTLGGEHSRSAPSLTQQHVEKIAQTQRLVEQLWGRHYKPTLILAPSQATNVWKNEIRRYFPEIQARYFFHSANRLVGSRDRLLTLGRSMTDLLRYLTTVPDTSDAIQHVIISSYTTWTKRSLYCSNATMDARADRVRNSTSKREPDDDVDMDDEDNDAEITQKEAAS